MRTGCACSQRWARQSRVLQDSGNGPSLGRGSVEWLVWAVPAVGAGKRGAGDKADPPAAPAKRGPASASMAGGGTCARTVMALASASMAGSATSATTAWLHKATATTMALHTLLQVSNLQPMNRGRAPTRIGRRARPGGTDVSRRNKQ